MRWTIISILIGCYRWSLRLYPAAFRAEFGDEMEASFATAVCQAAAEGPQAVAAVCLQETADFTANLVDAYWQVPVYAEGGVMKREISWNVWPAWVGLSLLSIPLSILAVMTLVLIIDRAAGPLLLLNGRATVHCLPRVIWRESTRWNALKLLEPASTITMAACPASDM